MSRCLSALFVLFLVNPLLGAAAPRERIVWVSLSSHFDLFVASADGTGERPFLPGASSYNASFSADGRWVVFTSERFGSPDVFRAHLDGTGLERLTDSPAFDDQGALSPDGRTLGFVSTREGGRANIWLIYIVHPDGTGLRRLTPLGQVAGSPKWSRDGRHLIYYQVADVEKMHHEGGIFTKVVSLDVGTGAPEVHTDGTSRAVSPQYVGETEIGYTVTERHERVRTTSVRYTSGRTGIANAENPSWSPDGSLVVYQRGERAKHGWVDVERSRDPRYELISGTPLSEDFLAFTPSGERFVYPSGQPYSQLNLVGWDGTDSRTGFKDEYLYSREIQSYGEIFAMRADGADVRQLTDNQWEELVLAWLPAKAPIPASAAAAHQ